VKKEIVGGDCAGDADLGGPVKMLVRCLRV